MRRQGPLIITFITGAVIILQYFIPHRPFSDLQQLFNSWFLVIAVFALILGIGNLSKIHIGRVVRRREHWPYSIVLIVGFVAMFSAGVIWGIQRGTPFYYIFWNIHIPMGSTMFALLAFFVASASYRAFRARTPEATVLLVSAIIVMLSRVPLGNFIWKDLPLVGDWIMAYPNMAGQRAIWMGIALGVVSTSLRIILGIERTYLSGR